MENELFFGKTTVNGNEKIYLKYYLISEKISAEYCNLMSYGIKAEKTVLYDGGGKTVETKQINNVFYRRADAEKFLKIILKNKVTPVSLRDVVEDYIIEQTDTKTA